MTLIKHITTLAVAFTALTALSGSSVFAQDKMGDKMSPAPSAMGSKMADKMGAKESAIKVTIGKFHKVAHNTKGTATIYENPNGTRELRLTGFSTAEGPAVHVYLVAAEDVTTDAAVTKAGYIDLGPLQKGKSSQTFKVPAKIDLWKYLAVTIWCDKFDVNFGTAPLTAAKH
ncbi:MAG: DM13 domain-containing protein [Akkermansiaceae bacterium]|nr:DM13 domain-containing protein [Armatimonadota bacterium]